MNESAIPRRTFLKAATSAVALVPLAGLTASREFVTKVHYDAVIGLHIIDERGQEWVVIEPCGQQFTWQEQVLYDIWRNFYWMSDVNDPKRMMLSCFLFERDGYANIHKSFKAFHP